MELGEKPEYKILEKRIRELEKENSHLKLFKFGLDKISNCMLVVGNREYRYEAISKGCLDLFNIREDEIIGKTATEIMGKKIFETLIKPNFDNALNGKDVNFSSWFKGPDSKKRFYNIQCYPVPGQKRIDKIVVIINDFTEIKQAEKALTKKEGRCSKAQQVAHMGNWSWNIKQDRIVCSDGFYNILGLSSKDFLPTYEGYLQQVHPEDIKLFHSFEKKELKDTSPYSKKYRIIRPDGEIRIIYERGEITLGFDGEPIDIFGTIQDITEQVEAEEQYQTIIRTAIDGFSLVDKKGKLLDVNDAYCRMLGYEREEILQLSLTDIDSDKISDEMIRQFKKDIKKRQCLFERKHRRKDGTLIDVEINAQYSGVKKGFFFSFIRDITEKNKIQKALIKSENRYRDLFEGAPVMYVVVENHNWIPIIRACNRQFLSSLKYSKEQILGRDLTMFYSEESKRKFDRESLFKKAMEEKNLISKRELVGHDGRIIHTLIQAMPEYDILGNLIGALVMYSDITERRQMERELIQADKMISLGTLVAGVAHEINNPNNFIMLNTSVLSNAWKDIEPVIEKYYQQNGDFSLSGLPYSQMKNEIPLLFEGLENGAVRIQRIVQDLKNFARQDDADMDQLIDINQTIKDSIRLSGNMIKEKTENFKVEYCKFLPVIKGNKQRLEQVLINLIQNACQALLDKKKGILIRSSFNKKIDSIIVEIKDEGVGVTPKMENHIMDPFFTTKRESGGTGLGLSVSSRIVKAHGGKIDFTSKPTKGSVFRIVLPVTGDKNQPLEIIK